MRYREALEFLASTSWYGERPGLAKIKAILRLLREPQKNYPVIQVTGTNGKSSVVWTASSILKAHNLKVGTYTSPHLNSYTERMQINGNPISKRDFCLCLEEVIGAVQQMEAQASAEAVTHFEVLTAAAYLYFAKELVDVAVIEVGLGARWDATSVVRPTVAVITNVALDHTDRLGDTLAKIAFEKSFVVKRGCTTVIGDLPQEARNVVLKRAQRFGSSVSEFAWSDDRVRSASETDISTSAASKHRSGKVLPMAAGLPTNKYGPEKIRSKSSGRIRQSVFDIRFGGSIVTGLEPQLLGSHQIHNVSVAVSAARELLARLGRSLEHSAVSKGVREARSPGRLDIVRNAPLTILDGAHNAQGIANIAREIRNCVTAKKLICLTAVLSDKELDPMLQSLSDIADILVISKNYFYRAADPEVVAEHVPLEYRSKVIIEPDLKKALKTATKLTGSDDLLLVTGSLYTVGHVRHILGLGPLEN